MRHSFSTWRHLAVAVVIVFATASGWAQDPCSSPSVGDSAGSVGSDGNGACSAIITVTAVDTNGNAIAFNVSSTGVNPYDGVEDILVGVVNGSGASLTSITLSSPDTTNLGLFAFDGDGPCNTLEHMPQYSWCPATYGYEGPDNTFTNRNTVTSGGPCTATTPCHTSGTVQFTSSIPNGGTTWFALEGSPQSLVLSGQTVGPTPLNTTTTNFPFNTPGATTVQTIDYTNSGTNPTSTGAEMQVTFQPISEAQFQNLVANTFAQNSSCMPQDIGNGTYSCAVTIALCINNNNLTPQGSNCPQASSGLIGVIMKYLTNAFGNDPTAVPNPGYLAATDNALSCNGATDTSNSCRKLYNIFTGIQNDCCTTSGGTKNFNSLFVPVFNLQTWYQPAGTTCFGDAGHQILQPINADGSSVWKQGRTIPVKFRVCNSSGVSVGTPGVVTSFKLVQIVSGTVSSVDETVTSTASDTSFRWDSTNQQWIFNLSTSSLAAGNTYRYAISLNDGTVINFQFGLR